jgi:hypothetical protein
MLRIYFLQRWFNLSDPQAEDAIYDSEAIRRFAPVELGDDVVPDETTILRFRHLLEQHRLTAAIFDAVKELLTAKRLLLKSGTIVDATIIAAPSSTKNADQARDPEMKQTRKRNAWHFGMKLHVGTDLRGRVHSLTATHAGAADITQSAAPAARGGRGPLRRPGVLEGSGSPGPGGAGRAVSSESARPRQAPAADHTLARDQSGALADPDTGRASLPRGQAALGASARSAIGAWPRTSRAPSSRLRWRISTWSAGSCFPRRAARCDGSMGRDTPVAPGSEALAPFDWPSIPHFSMNLSATRRRTATCAELP